MSEVFNIMNVALGVFALIGWLLGVVAWIRRGFTIPMLVHKMAILLEIIGVAVTVAALQLGIRSLPFVAFALLGFPIWAYAGWFLAGCPNGTQSRNESHYDISHLLSGKRK